MWRRRRRLFLGERLTQRDEKVARYVTEMLLTLIQNQNGSLVDDLAQFALNTSNKWTIKRSAGSVSVYMDLDDRRIYEVVSAENHKFLGDGKRCDCVRFKVSGEYYYMQKVKLSTFLFRFPNSGGRSFVNDYIFRASWDILIDHPTYEQAACAVLRRASNISANRYHRSFWFPEERG